MRILGVIAALLLGTGNLAHAWPWDSYETYQNVRYGKTSAEIADLYVPKSGANHPALIMVHGGAWVSGTKDERNYYATTFANAGFAVFNINYRLLNLQTGANPWPAQIEDSQLAVRWLRAHAQEYHIDTDRVCAWGDSAGGHLVLLLGTMTKTKPGDRSTMYAEQSSTVNCVIDLFGPSDLTAESAVTLKDVLKSLFGGKTLEEARAEYADASAVNHLSSKTGPILIVQGLTDNIVLPAQSMELDAKLTAAHVPHPPPITFNGGHWYDKIRPQSAKAQVEAEILNWIVNLMHPNGQE